MIIGRFRPGLAILWCIILAHATLAAETQPVVYTTERLLRCLDDMHRGIRAWSIEYQGTGTNLAYYVRETLAARFPDSCLYRTAKGPADIDWQSEVIDPRWSEDAFQDWVLRA